MSATAPWIALSIDWHESDMFDDEATDGERLAWICLLCHAKAYGRGGRVRVRKSALAATYRLSMRSVEGMLARAQKCGSAVVDGESVTIVNWGVYQWKATRSGGGIPDEMPEKRRKVSTKQDRTIQDNTGQDKTIHNPPNPPAGGTEGGCKGETIPPVLNTEPFRQAWSDWQAHRREIKKPMTDRSGRMALKQLEAMGHDRAIACITHSIANGWQGLFEPNRNGVGTGGYRDHAAERRAAERAREFPSAPIQVRDL